jgi:hypothetical protein
MAAVGAIGMVLAASAVYLFIFRNFLGAELRFRQVVAIFSYSGIPNLINTLLAILIMHLKPPEEFDIQNPTMFNAGAYLPEGTSATLVSLASSLDLFVFWALALLIVGMRAAAPRLSTGAVAAAVLAPWVLWVIAKTGWTGLFS